MVKIRYLMLLLSEGLYRIRFIVVESLMEEDGQKRFMVQNQRLDISSEMVRQVQKLVKSIDETHQKGNLVTMLEDETLIYLPQLLYNIKHSSWSYEKEYRCIIASTANGMPFIDAKPKAI